MFQITGCGYINMAWIHPTNNTVDRQNVLKSEYSKQHTSWHAERCKSCSKQITSENVKHMERKTILSS
jgi:hypothetical protein